MAPRRPIACRTVILWSAVWCACIAGFVLLGAAVSGRESPGLDLDVARNVQKLPDWSGALFRMANFLSGEWRLTLLIALLTAILLAKGRTFDAGLIAASMVPRTAQEGLKELFDAPRPAVDALTVRELADSAAYPSGHVAGTTVVFVLLFVLAPRLTQDARLVILLRCFSAAMIAIVPVARVWVGAHWPSDCLGAYLLAAVWLIPVLMLWHARQGTSARATLAATKRGQRL